MMYGFQHIRHDGQSFLTLWHFLHFHPLSPSSIYGKFGAIQKPDPSVFINNNLQKMKTELNKSLTRLSY